MKRLGSNAMSNLLGALLPAAVYLWSVPLTLHYLGESGYGVFAILTAVVGYFAVIDLNVTSGALKYISEFHARREHDSVNEVITLGLVVYLVIGILGMAAIFLTGPWLVREVFEIPRALESSAITAVRYASVGFLFSQLQVFLLGIPQALQRYDLAGGCEAVFGVLAPSITVATLAAGWNLDGVMFARSALTALNVFVLAIIAWRLFPGFSIRKPTRSVASRVASFSGFAYLSRLTTLTYVQGDKLILGAIAGAAAVSQYVIPQSLVSRLFAMSFRLAAVVMPAASALAARGDAKEVRRIGLGAARYTLYLNACMTVFLILLAGTLLKVWLGDRISEVTCSVLIFLAIGSLFNSATNVPALINDGLGHAKVSGLFAITHSVLGLACAFSSISAFGVLGAAGCQVVVSLVMAVAFNVFVANRTVPWSLREYWFEVVRPSLPLLGLCGVAVVFGRDPQSLGAALGWALIGGAALTVYAVAVVLLPEHRQQLLARIRRFR